MVKSFQEKRHAQTENAERYLQVGGTREGGREVWREGGGVSKGVRTVRREIFERVRMCTSRFRRRMIFICR